MTDDNTTSETEANRYPNGIYVDGAWTGSTSTIAVTDLADGGTFAEIAAAEGEHVERALTVADRARTPLATATVPERTRWLETVAERIDDRADELAEVIVREAGKPVSAARSEVESAAERFRRAVGEIRALTGEYREGTTPGHDGWAAIVKHDPVGVVCCITPYNYPLSTTAQQIAPALAAGNAIILKPASNTPISGLLLAEILADASLPDGAFQFLPGRGSDIGSRLVGDDRVNAISMTGSADAGKRVAAESGMAQLQLELGGNAPAVVFRDADLDTASTHICSGALKYAGQRCSAVSRVLVHEPVHDQLVEGIDTEMNSWNVGNPLDETTDIGPVISGDHAMWVDELVEDAVDRGADCRRGGTYTEVTNDVYVYQPTLLADVPQDARILAEEQFGPVVAVTAFEDESTAPALANESDYALDAAVFTSDYNRAREVADRIDAGAVRINGAPSHGLGDVPFGGNGRSGIGRQGLHLSITDFVETKSIIL